MNLRGDFFRCLQHDLQKASTKRYLKIQASSATSKRYLKTLPLMGATRLASGRERNGIQTLLNNSCIFSRRGTRRPH